MEVLIGGSDQQAAILPPIASVNNLEIHSLLAAVGGSLDILLELISQYLPACLLLGWEIFRDILEFMPLLACLLLLGWVILIETFFLNSYQSWVGDF